MRIANSAIRRIVNATKWVEEYGYRENGIEFNARTPIDYVWWGETKQRINHEADGEVFVVKGSAVDPVKGDSAFTVANPHMGDLVTGVRVLVVPAIVREKTTDQIWHVAPFHLIYECKAKEQINFGTVGDFEIYKDGSATGEEVQAHFRWVPGSGTINTDQNARIVWDWLNQRFVVDAYGC